METKIIQVDLTGVESVKSLILRFNDAFGFSLQGNSWDAFSDSLRSLSTESKIINQLDQMPNQVHLIIKNIFDVAKFSRKEYGNLCEILVYATDINNRDSDIKFTFEVQNDKK